MSRSRRLFVVEVKAVFFAVYNCAQSALIIGWKVSK